MGDNVFICRHKCLHFGIAEKEDGSQEWIVTLLIKESFPLGSGNLKKIFTGYGDNWREICDEKSYSVGDRDLIARLNSIASEKALGLISAGSDD